MKWPLAGVACLFASGVLLGVWLSLPLPFWFGALFLACVLALFGGCRVAWSLEVGLVLAGACHVSWVTRPLAPDDLVHQASASESIATVRGWLEATPELRLHRNGARVSTNALAVMVCREFLAAGSEAWRSCSGRVLVSSSVVPPEEFRSGALVEISGVLRRPRGPLAPGTFDYSRYLHWQGIEFELRATESGDWRWAPGALPPLPVWSDRFQAWARRVLALGLSAEEEETQLLWAMALGWKTALTPEVDEPFMRSGTMHVFAISGLHIALLAAIAGQVLRLLMVPRVATGLGVIAVCWAYTLATGLQSSAVRSTIMTTLVVGGMMWSRPSNMLNSLAAAALAVLVWDPRQLFQAGFQLSFAVVGALGLLGMPIRRGLTGWMAPDPMLARSAIPWWRRQCRVPWGWISGSVAVGVASWLGSLPLGATHFHLVTFSGFVANLVVVPLSSCALAGNAASLACGVWAPGLSELFNHASWLFMRGMLGVSRWAAALPWGCWNVAAPPVSMTALWYLLVIATGLGWWRRGRARAVTLSVAMVLTVAGGLELWRATDRLRVVILPLGAGHAVWVCEPGGTGLVDAGDASMAERVTMPFLRAQGVNRLAWLALTHGDIRHVGGVSNVLSRFGAGRVVLGPGTFRSGAYRAALEACRRVGLRVTTDAMWRSAGGVWRRRHPEVGDRYGRADDGCLVLDYSGSGTRLAFWADLDRQGQERLLERSHDEPVDVLVLAPPGSGALPAVALLERLRPRWVVVADAAMPATARARAPFRAVVEGCGAEVFYTSETGSLDLRWDGRSWRALNAAGKLVGRQGVAAFRPAGTRAPGRSATSGGEPAMSDSPQEESVTEPDPR